MDKTSLEVAETLLSEHGIETAVTKGVINAPDAEHYSVQWNESDWDYLVRRLEADGLFWWVVHEGGTMGSVAATHRLHIAGDPFGYTEAPGSEAGGDGGAIRFAMGSADRNRIDRFDRTFEFTPGARATADWNFLTPGTVPANATPSLVKHPAGASGNEVYELYEYPAHTGYGTGGERGASEGIDNQGVEARSRLRMMAAEADHERVRGSGDVRTLAPGRRFTPYDVANPHETFEEHAIASIVHTAQDRSYETNEGEPDYGCTFEAVPARVPLTPHRKTHRPRIDGQQVAIVAGPEGEEIHTDEFGRIKVWFPWDRTATRDGTDTCWLRVAQSWAGHGWGAQVIPRIGMEVLVSYLDGDPDRPLVTGVVPNPRKKVPYPLPENKTKSVFRTNTYKSNNWKRSNEITFEDHILREEIFIHAERDRNEKTRNNHTERIDANWAQSIGHNKAVEVDNNHQEIIGGNMSVFVGPQNLGTFVSRFTSRLRGGIGRVASVIGMESVIPAGRGNYFLGVEMSKSEIIGTTNSTIVGSSSVHRAGTNVTIGAGNSLDLSAGDNLEIRAGIDLVASGDDTVELRSGETRVVVRSNGDVLINGARIQLKASDTLSFEAENSITLRSARIDLNS